jgi:hypothetical protein
MVGSNRRQPRCRKRQAPASNGGSIQRLPSAPRVGAEPTNKLQVPAVTIGLILYLPGIIPLCSMHRNRQCRRPRYSNNEKRLQATLDRPFVVPTLISSVNVGRIHFVTSATNCTYTSKGDFW